MAKKKSEVDREGLGIEILGGTADCDFGGYKKEQAVELLLGENGKEPRQLTAEEDNGKTQDQ